MMKSFFKKLAFVMALAMVVSLAAPAGSALAADYSLNVTVQGTKVAIKEYNLAKVGDTVDFQFWKAPSNWADDYEWDYTVPGIVAVDKAGVVTALAEGTTTVTITVLDQYYGAVEVTVGEKVVEVEPTVAPTVEPTVAPTVEPTVAPTEAPVDNSYTYKQISHNTATFTFNKDVSFTSDEVTLTKIFDGEYEINWPIETVKCDKNVVTVSPFVPFADGDVYVIRLGANDEGTKFTTKLGKVDYIEISYKSMGENGVAYAKYSEDDPNVEVELSCKLFSNGVDVTKAEGYSVDEVEFELKKESDNFDLDGNILIFENAKEAAIVKAVYTYEDGEEEKEFEIEAPVYPTPLTPYGIKSIDKWTIAKAGSEIDWTKVDHDIPAFDDEKAEYDIVVLMTDTYGNKIVYPNFKCKDFAGKKIYTLDDVKTSSTDDKDLYIEAAEDFEIRFKSTNDNKLFVSTYDGLITTLVGDVNVPVLVSLYDKNDEGDTVLVKTLLAPTVEVDAARKADKITATVKNETLPTAGDFTSGTVEFVVVDQYGDPYTAGVSVAISEGNDKVKIEGKATLADPDKAKYTFAMDGTDFLTEKGKVVDSIKFTAKVNDNVKTTFTVKAKAPEVKDGEFVINGYAIEVADVDQMIKKEADGTLKKAEITVYELSKGLKVGIAKDVQLVTADNALKGLLKDSKTFQVNSSQAEKGDLFLAVYGKDGKAITSAASSTALGIAGSAGKYTVNVATADGNTMKYMDALTYTVDLYQVEKEYTTDKLSKLDTYTEDFVVKNTSATVKFDSQTEDAVDGMNIEELVAKCFKFTTFKWDDVDADAVITGVKYKYNEGSGRVYVYYVNFLVPLNAKDDTVGYTVNKVTVNKYVEVTDFDESIKSVE